MAAEIAELQLLSAAINSTFGARNLSGVRVWARREVGRTEDGKKVFETSPHDCADFVAPARISAHEAGRRLLVTVSSLEGVTLGAYLLDFGMKGWMGAVDANLPSVDSSEICRPTPTRQRVAVAPLTVVPPTTTEASRWKHVTVSFRFEDTSTLRLMDDSCSAKITWIAATQNAEGVFEVPTGEVKRSVSSVSTAEELTALLNSIVTSKPNSKSPLLSEIQRAGWSFGLGELLYVEWFHRARVSPYVAVADARNTPAIVEALGSTLHDVIRARVEGQEAVVYGRVEKSRSIGTVKNVYYVRDQCMYIESEPPRERKPRAAPAGGDSAPKKRARGAAGAAAAAAGAESGVESSAEGTEGAVKEKKAPRARKPKADAGAAAAAAAGAEGGASDATVAAPKEPKAPRARKAKSATPEGAEGAAAAADGAVSEGETKVKKPRARKVKEMTEGDAADAESAPAAAAAATDEKTKKKRSRKPSSSDAAAAAAPADAASA